jgi:hypothetical protein
MVGYILAGYERGGTRLDPVRLSHPIVSDPSARRVSERAIKTHDALDHPGE